MAFSGAVKLGDLDDFLAPSQACIKPQIDEAKAKKSKQEGGSVKIEMDMSDDFGHFDQINTTAKSTAAITLADCLACSGCVTSAETILITQQSTNEFLSHLPTSLAQQAEQMVVVSVSPQSRTSLAETFKLTPLQVSKKLTTFFKSIGVSYVVDTTASLDITLLEARREFLARFQSKTRLPLLTSECPGWICYAEKTQGDFVLPYISNVKSPQQVMGILVKGYLAHKLNVDPAKIYHCTVMPCYDKKLEATRGDFELRENVREVDCVISTGELHELLVERGGLAPVPESMLDPLNSVTADQSSLLGPIDTGASGGYAENVMRFCASHMFNVQLQQIEWTPGKNSDIHEASIQVDGKVVLSVARAYGFRNIQNLIRLIKRKKCNYHYVEIMACPSGCLNGGGQVREAKTGITAQKALVNRLDSLYHSTMITRAPDASPLVREIYESLIKGDVGSESAAKAFHTQYKAVEKIEVVNPMGIKW